MYQSDAQGLLRFRPGWFQISAIIKVTGQLLFFKHCRCKPRFLITKSDVCVLTPLKDFLSVLMSSVLVPFSGDNYSNKSNTGEFECQRPRRLISMHKAPFCVGMRRGGLPINSDVNPFLSLSDHSNDSRSKSSNTTVYFRLSLSICILCVNIPRLQL